VENKTKKTTKKIIQFIKKKHNSESGIIYCLSKKECEAMARKLQAAKIQANFYHAGLSPAKREKVQRCASFWSSFVLLSYSHSTAANAPSRRAGSGWPESLR
jgi:superfamily II DNA helicase RecQ